MGRSGLESVVIPENVKLGKDVFKKCKCSDNICENIKPGDSIQNCVVTRVAQPTTTTTTEAPTTTTTKAPTTTTTKAPTTTTTGEPTTEITIDQGNKTLTQEIVNNQFKKYNTTHDTVIRIIIPDGVTEIGDSVFRRCVSLTSVVIPDSVTIIGHSAFNQRSSLASIDIPNSVTSIGDYVFARFTALLRLKFRTVLPV